MELFIILIVIPVIAIVAFLIAVVWGFAKAKNPKRYFISLACVVGVVLFLVSMLFIDYKSFVVNTFSVNKLPPEYRRGYYDLKDTVTSDFTIKKLDGQAVEWMFVDSASFNFIVVTHDNGSEYKEFYHLINPAGRLIGSFTCPEELYREGRFLVGPYAYCDRIVTGDTIAKAYTSISGIQNRESLRQRYQKADFVRFFSDSICVLHQGDVWYSCKVDFEPKDYSDEEEYKGKTDFTEAGLEYISFNIQPNPDAPWPDWPIEFKECPASTGDGVFLFEYFAKDEYYSGFSSLFSGIGSPTGGSSHSPTWYGTGYCRLRVGDQYIPFACYMEHELGHWEAYSTELSIYSDPNYAILSSSFSTYMVYVRR